MDELITIDGVQYDPRMVPQHVLHLLGAFRKAADLQAEKQSELLVYNHAVQSLSAQVRGAMSVIPPYVPETAAPEAAVQELDPYVPED